MKLQHKIINEVNLYEFPDSTLNMLYKNKIREFEKNPNYIFYLTPITTNEITDDKKYETDS